MSLQTGCIDGVRDGVDENGVARLEIDRPAQMNALDGAASARLITVCHEWAARTDIRAVVISGRGGSFCAGADVAGMADDAAAGGGFDESQARGIIENGSNLIGAVRSLRVPVVAAVDGPAVGIGASLAVACDLVYATARSYFLLAFVNIGLMPDGGASALFTASLGRARANAMALLGEKLPAADAFDAGLLTAVADDEEGLSAQVDRALGRLLRASPEALKTTKSALDAHSLGGYDEAIAREIAGQTALLQSPQFQQILAGFAKH
ncbi:enoyl-CoA hydratase-related protein [Gordonia humi]|uniref:Enoyl-CoA hydratase/carnithine racemase n=1 Tax=Gordonia humi TaxID=686429 RepID=A0A840EZH2_9ACTN|nr:enoyl-CoA hydratase-related protein [Gordonia humi]MBB4137001.1 enoyl-CoA hydratase/carnithine racemase [Gordonia humi]